MRILHLSDLHFTSRSRTVDSGYLIDSHNSQLKATVLADFLIANKSRLNASTVVITGDITDSGDASDYAIAREFLTRLRDAGFDVNAVPGNHDYCKEGTLWFETAASAGERRERFRQSVCSRPYPEVVDRGVEGCIVLLDSMHGELEDWENSDSWAQGRLGRDQLQRLRQIVQAFQPRRPADQIVVCLHHSPFHNPHNDQHGCLQDAEELLAILSGKVDGLLFGHTTRDGNLQESFPADQVPGGIPLINCENLEHDAWSPETELLKGSHRMCVGQGHDGRLEVFYVGADSKVYRKGQSGPGGPWSDEAELGGAAVQLCVERNQNGCLELFYLGMDARVHHVRQLTPNGAWGPSQPMGGRWLGEDRIGHEPGPAQLIDAAREAAARHVPEEAQLVCAARNADGRLEAFYVGQDYRILHQVQHGPNGFWGSPAPLEGTARDLCVGQNTDGRLELFSVGTDDRIYHQWQIAPDGAWSNRERLGGKALQMCVARDARGLLELFYVGTNSRLYRNAQATGGGWEGEQALGGFAKQICIGQNTDGSLEVFYVGTNTSIYHNRERAPGKGWTGEQSLRGFVVAGRQLCVAQNTDGRLEVLYVGTNFHGYHIWQTLPNEAYPVTVVDTATSQLTVVLAGETAGNHRQ